jgi:D-sedoheptulose 7-phosphate isomerase
MFDFGFSELVVCGIVGLVVLGPERLPVVAKTAGQWIGKAQRFVQQMKDDINRESELAELKKIKDDAQHIAAELVGRFVTEREGLPAIAMTTDTSILTAVSNDYGFDRVFERQTAALGTKGDILIGLSTSGNSPNVEHALQKAQSMGITTIGLLGRDGGRCKELCNYPLIIQHAESARIQEVHITIGHILCGIVDNKLFSHE